MSKLFYSMKPGALAAVLLIGGVPAVRTAAALEAAPKPATARQAESCPVTDAQQRELVAIHQEATDLGAVRAPASARVDAALARIDRLTHELTRCLEPQIKSMIAQAGSGPAQDLVERVKATAMRLATDNRMPDEERSRLTEQLASDTEKLRAETGHGAAGARELQEQNRIFNNKINGNLGIALRELDKEKHELLRLRG
jgi:hypothetical protein